VLGFLVSNLIAQTTLNLFAFANCNSDVEIHSKEN
jgi:hypothetical protein